MFQSDNVDSLKLLSELTGLLLNYLSILIPPERLQRVTQDELATFNFRDCVMNTRGIHLGYLFVEESANVPIQDLNIIKERCTQCLIRLCEEIQMRLPNNIKLLEKNSIFSPQIATSQVRPNIEDIVVGFKDVLGGVENVDATLQEWRILPLQQWKKTKTADEFWGEVLSYKNACGDAAFFNLTKLATAILSLPFSVVAK
ncbi:unnamed protein product [Parnassius apollo]|uniref:(apollo) hypothetical protein n=1 Tax=Parnassius apollo TaxID=110799 RepID=A0A8S3Y6I0_PARAO|nr:unnamed protein product [Parnassius apollo]